MFSSNVTHKFSLFILLAVSIPNITADTNIPENPDRIATESGSTENTQNMAINPLIAECRECAQNLEVLISRVFEISVFNGNKLEKAIDPVLSCTVPLKELPDTASNNQINAALSILNYSSLYLIKLLEKDFDKAEEFNPNISSKENISQPELEETFRSLANSFGDLMIKVNEIDQDFWGNLLMHVRNQLMKLDTILQTINNNIENNSNIVNKKDIKNDVKNLRRLLQQIQREITAAGPDPLAILTTHKVSKALINYLQEAQLNKFRKWAEIDLTKELNRSQVEVKTIGQLFVNIMMTNDELEKLEKDAEKIDLNMINKAARFMGDYIIDPIQQYNLNTYAMALFVGGWYASYYFDDYFFNNKDSLFRRMFGFRDHSLGKQVMTIESEKLQPDKPIKWFGKTEGFIYDQMHNITPIGAFLSLSILDRIKTEWKEKKPYLSRKIHVWFNKLKGGSMAKIIENKYDQVISSITFDDIIGLEYEKSLIYPHLKYIKDPERWDANGLTPPTGILLTGPTRSGKTFFAKAICGEIHRQNPDKTIRFVSIDAHDIKADGIATWMGVAKMLAPCVLFIDEIDLLGLQRTQDKTLLSDFLQALSGIADKDPKKQVIVVGTTNKPENIDTALIQSGRFALEIRFKYPNLEERKEFITKRLDKFAIDPEAFGIDIDKLAREMHDKSFEDIKLMIDSAFIHVGIKGQMISHEILEWAMDTQLRKIIDIDTKQISAGEKQLLAAHIAGQTLAHILLNMNEKIAKATIRQVVVKVKEESAWAQLESKDHQKQSGFDQGALFTYLEHDSLDIKSQSELLKKAKTFLAARIAERIITNNCSTHFGWKKNAAFNMIKSVVSDGLDIKSLSENGQNALSDEAHAMLKEFEKEIEQLLLEHKDSLIAITQALYAKQTLTFDQIMAIIDGVENKNQQEVVVPDAEYIHAGSADQAPVEAIA